MLLAVPAMLSSDLLVPLGSVGEARDRAAASLRFLSGLQANDFFVASSGLVLRTVLLGASSIVLRPLNPSLFIEDVDEYLVAVSDFEKLVGEITKQRGKMTATRAKEVRAEHLISRVLYTTLQSQAFAMDCLLPANQARKNFGMRFEELIEHLLASLGVGCKPITFGLSYQTSAGLDAAVFKSGRSVIAQGLVQSTANELRPDEVVVSLKTSSKDRFAKIFLDQEMLQFVTQQTVKVIAIFHNDVQRSGIARTSWTFVAGNFSAYVARFGPLTGVYYVDPPPQIGIEPWSTYLRTLTTYCYATSGLKSSSPSSSTWFLRLLTAVWPLPREPDRTDSRLLSDASRAWR